MKKLILSTSLIFCCLGSSALATNYIRNFSAQRIEDGNYPVLTVWSGSGLTLNFTSLTGEFVKSIWLDDPSKLVLDYAGELCSLPCRGGVKIIHLKRVTGLHFPNLPSTAKTTLTVVTISSSGDKVYKFILGYGSGKPQYFTVNVTPGQISRPAFNQRLPGHSPVEVSPVPKISSSRNSNQVDSKLIQLLEQGLEVARNQLKPTKKNSLLWHRLKVLIADLQSGYSQEQALKRNSLSANALESIINLGQSVEIEEGRRQEAEGRRSDGRGIPTRQQSKTAKQSFGGGRSPKCAQGNRATQPISQPPASCPLPSAFGAQRDDALVESEKPKLTSVTNTVKEEAPNSRQIANYIVRGLIVAAQKKQINYGTRTYRQVHSAVRALRRGNNLTQAAQISQVKLSVLEQLIAWGKE